jgi:hypothetical protein
VRYDQFESTARARWDQVPAEYKAGVDGLIIERDARAHPELDEIYTLGECVTESFPSDFGGPDTTRSAVVLYYGSFLRLAHLDSSFEWEEEIWETITHELKHHLESLATEDDLEDFDYAVDQNFQRLEGEPFDPLFFRAGEVVAENLYRVEQDVFLEIDPSRFGADSWIEFTWDGAPYRIPRPATTADVGFVRVLAGPDLQDDTLWLVLVPRRGALRALGDALRRRPLEVSESDATAHPV